MNRGRSTFFYREGNVNDPARRRELAAYELVFRAMPILPRPWLRHVDVRKLMALPPGLTRIVGLFAEVAVSIARRNPEWTNYLDQYSLGLRNHFRDRLDPGRRGPREADGAPIVDPTWGGSG